MSLLKKCKKVAFKTLSSVEIDNCGSNQHELHGAKAFKVLLGQDRQSFEGTVSYIDSTDEYEGYNTTFTWYDAREEHATRSEYRLYYTNEISVFDPHIGGIVMLSKDEIGELHVIFIDNQEIIQEILENKHLFVPYEYRNGSSYFAKLKDVPFLKNLL